MVALVDAVKSGEIPASEVAVVISDKADAAGLAKAKERGVETVVITRERAEGTLADTRVSARKTREEHDAEVIAELQKRGVELVCLAGYMRLLSPLFVQAFPDRIVNIHPSLLPAYPGLNVHERVLAAGEKMSGCTVHYVNEDLDAGSVILQREVEVKDGDTVETLSTRILEQEHKLYVEAVRGIVLRRITKSELAKLPERIRYLHEVLSVGHDTSMRGEGVSLREALRRTDYENRRQKFGAADLIPIIETHRYYIQEWIMYSEDKHTSGGWWIEEKPLLIGNLKSRETISFDSTEQAIAEYVIRELDFWADLNSGRKM